MISVAILWLAPPTLVVDSTQAHAMPPTQGHDMAITMTGALGAYPMSRDASGTVLAARRDRPRHGTRPARRLDADGPPRLDGVYDWQEGPRGDEKTSWPACSWARPGATSAPATGSTLRAMLSPDPFMGKRGYPLLLAAGETADGVTPLVDRQHPHDLFMELSAS